MVLSAKAIADQIRLGNDCDAAGISIVPAPDVSKIEQDGEASVSLRLGRWFLTLRQSSDTHISLDPEKATRENRIAKQYFVPFGEKFVLHPNRFVLASTLEWVRLPLSKSALVIGKSTLGRRGIIIETAAGVHPGFSGCLTLEIANVGEMPVELISGMPICQLFFHSIEGKLGKSQTSLAGQRKPRLGTVKTDGLLQKLISTRI